MMIKTRETKPNAKAIINRISVPSTCLNTRYKTSRATEATNKEMEIPKDTL